MYFLHISCEFISLIFSLPFDYFPFILFTFHWLIFLSFLYSVKFSFKLSTIDKKFSLLHRAKPSKTRVSRTKATNRMNRIRNIFFERLTILSCSTQRHWYFCCWKTSFVVAMSLERRHTQTWLAYRWLCGEQSSEMAIFRWLWRLGSLVHWIHSMSRASDRCKTKWNEYMSKIVQHRLRLQSIVQRLHDQGIQRRNIEHFIAFVDKIKLIRDGISSMIARLQRTKQRQSPRVNE